MSVTEFPIPPRKVNFDWISESFRIFQRDAWTWVGALAIFGLLAVIVAFGIQKLFIMAGFSPIATPDPANPFASIFTPNYFAYSGVSELIGLPLNAFLLGGIYKMANKAVRTQPLAISDLFSGGETFLQFLIALLIIMVLTYLGLLALLVGVFVVMGLILPAYSLIADGESATDAISKSFNAMKADWLNAGAFVFVFCMLYLLSACCIAGVFVTIPMAFICTSLANRDMVGMAPAQVIETYRPAQPGSWPPPPSSEAPRAAPSPEPAPHEPGSAEEPPAFTDESG